MARQAERRYASLLKELASNVGSFVERLALSGQTDQMTALLHQYARALVPWAQQTASTMLEQVNQRDLSAWNELGTTISTQLRAELRNAPVAAKVDALLAEQVELITSIPTKAAERAQKLATEAFVGGGRVNSIIEEIQRTTQVTESRARLIARDAVQRAATGLTEARSEAIGSTSYVWRTARDSAVRESHREMEGRVVQWDSPPTLDGMTGHAGTFPRCRCYPEPLIPDSYQPTVRGRRRH